MDKRYIRDSKPFTHESFQLPSPVVADGKIVIISQDVEAIDSRLTSRSANGYISINQDAVMAYLCAVVNDLKKQVEDLKKPKKQIGKKKV